MSSATFRQCWSVVGGLGLGWLSRDDVELRSIEECVDQCLLGSDSGPVWVDVVGEAPALVSRPGEGGREGPHGTEGFMPAAEVGQRSVDEEVLPMGDVTMGPRSTEGGTLRPE